MSANFNKKLCGVSVKASVLAVAGFVGSAAWASADVISVFATGVDAAGNTLSAGSIDPHYTFSDRGSPGVVYSALWYEWLPDTQTSAWIGFRDSGDTAPHGTHDIITTFDLTGYDPATARLTGSWIADQYGSLFLNGNLVQTVLNENWNYLHGQNPTPFDITSGFVSGVNTLNFRVVFPDDFDGLRVLPMTLTANPGDVPDQGTTCVLLGVTLMGVVWLRRNCCSPTPP